MRNSKDGLTKVMGNARMCHGVLYGGYEDTFTPFDSLRQARTSPPRRGNKLTDSDTNHPLLLT